MMIYFENTQKQSLRILLVKIIQEYDLHKLPDQNIFLIYKHRTHPRLVVISLWLSL